MVLVPVSIRRVSIRHVKMLKYVLFRKHWNWSSIINLDSILWQKTYDIHHDITHTLRAQHLSDHSSVQ